jgi:dTMP kinase
MKKFFICFTGIDGTGKTTQAKKLANNLSSKGTKSKYVYARFIPRITRVIIFFGNLIFLKKENTTSYSERKNSKRKLLSKHFVLSKIYYKILFIDYRIQIFLKIDMNLLLGNSIICDRYLYDTIITDVAIDLGLNADEIFQLIINKLNSYPKPDIVFLLDIDEEISYSRKSDINSIEYLKDRRKSYLSIGNKLKNFIIIDSNRDINLLENEILEKSLLQLKALSE